MTKDIYQLTIFIIFTISLTYAESTNVELEKACTLNNSKACFDLGEKYIYEDSKNKMISIIYFKKACSLGYTKSCFSVGTLYDKGRKTKEEAVKYYTIACEKGIGRACNNLGNKYKNGSGVDKNTMKALNLFKTACDSEDGVEKGCQNKINLEEEIKLLENK